ncbi:SRPBCC family protein [Desertivirga xinjiangensis]|uniref:SRPBCC family protein n=1 Tax=Desertivirga xinjiangensis TaxID=539206 RepID=UPI00210E9348|nr:SRPBCC family protein [Pedobacter xinjiangensis]
MAIVYPDMYKNTEDIDPIVNDSHINVNTTERVISVLAGSFLFFSGLKNLRNSPVTGLARLVAGGALFARGASGHCPVYERLGTDSTKPEAINIKHYFTIDRPREEVYQFWRNLENLPLFMRHLESVEKIDHKHSKWKASFGRYLPSVSWTAEIVKERENEFIGWSSIKDSAIVNIGKVEFYDLPDSTGTEVRVIFSYHAPVGGVGTGLARLFTPGIEKIIHDDISNFKRYVEGEDLSMIDILTKE